MLCGLASVIDQELDRPMCLFCTGQIRLHWNRIWLSAKTHSLTKEEEKKRRSQWRHQRLDGLDIAHGLKKKLPPFHFSGL